MSHKVVCVSYFVYYESQIDLSIISETQTMKPFVPDKLPLEKISWTPFIELLGKANRVMARYDGILQSLPNQSVLLSPLTTHEAVLSSKIEGTHATLTDVLKYDANESVKEKGGDIKEVLNYRQALRLAEKELQTRPISLNLLKRMQKALLSDVRGKDISLGQFRTFQNFIGKPGSKIDEARFIPPAPDHLKETLNNFEKYIHYDEKDRLVQLAVIHAQFEIIHPFGDGNGRIGRILIPLFLFEKGILNSPMFYISAYFERHRDEYYSRLKDISDKGNWQDWILFFLKALIEQGQKTTTKAQDILKIYNHMKSEIPKITHSQYSIQALDFLFNYPIFDSRVFKRVSRIPKASSDRIISKLFNEKIVEQMEAAKGRTPALYVFTKLFNIVES